MAGNACPAEITLKVIGGKWKMVILWHLRGRIKRFSELKRGIPGVTQRMLTQQLRELEKNGVVSRRVFPQVPARVEYSITDFGRTLDPILDLMCRWGAEYQGRVKGEAETEVTV